MMRNRHFLFGLGAGLIIGALLLQLMNVAQTQPQMLNTEEEVRNAAKALGLKVYDSSEQVYSEQEWKERENGEPAGTTASAPPSPSSPEEPSEPSTPAEPSTPSKAEAPAPSPAPAEMVDIRIPAGSTLSQVADRLKSAGVITDKEAFVQLAKKWNATRIIQTGTFTFTKGESFKSITNKITKKK
ncbi:hypothetical protein AWM70_05115 [Paenibacillus yonginensis]|uniref:Aminodeoxychorismate lyase n=1 Tax=Paenibacillus yonginensis TaxID=1462996 RepID=A0A1B1MXZ4_9BACL|nr:endolytic transglycosylase MltG [Paenibacillus yonginensis]ANS74027.1 hypothetical protein AWM70_05115 [Paenibacillus yonginensis]